MESITKLLQSQREFFDTHQTKPLSFRKQQLRVLLDLLIKHENEFTNAIQKDFSKPELETFVSETGYLINEIKHTLSNIENWATPRPVTGSILSFPSSNKIYQEPYGVCLIIAPWNYPLALALSPLIGTIAAGNCAVIKPSELTPYTTRLLSNLISSNFDPDYIKIVEGGKEVSEQLLKEKWDYIFFTGSTRVGKIIMKAAAEHLTPVTLELGGKSPCIVDETANVQLAAKKITYGKFFNAGQTCIAPDYVLVHSSKKEELILQLKKSIESFYGKNPSESPDYARIINDSHFERLKAYLKDGSIEIGGKYDAANRYLSPTVLTNVDIKSSVMQEEIFGSVLPVITFATINEAIKTIRLLPKPLSLYLFSNHSSNKKLVLNSISFGGGAINETLEHYINHNLPFGGTGTSGMGAYHGKYSFDTFSHSKSVLSKSSWFDLPVKYPPYEKKKEIIRKLFKFA